jgi:hypothetical protein
VGRCYGALFFSIFGGVWLLLGAYALSHLGKAVGFLIAVTTGVFVLKAMRLRRRGEEGGRNAYPAEEQRRNDRLFGIINAVTWVAVFLEFQILTRLGRQDLAVAALALIVGLHFFPMPPLYQHRANLVTGTFLVAWAVLCALLLSGDRMIGFVSLGAGGALWLSAAWALKTAERLLRSVSL